MAVTRWVPEYFEDILWAHTLQRLESTSSQGGHRNAHQEPPPPPGPSPHQQREMPTRDLRSRPLPGPSVELDINNDLTGPSTESGLTDEGLGQESIVRESGATVMDSGFSTSGDSRSQRSGGPRPPGPAQGGHPSDPSLAHSRNNSPDARARLGFDGDFNSTGIDPYTVYDNDNLYSIELHYGNHDMELYGGGYPNGVNVPSTTGMMQPGDHASYDGNSTAEMEAQRRNGKPYSAVAVRIFSILLYGSNLNCELIG